MVQPIVCQVSPIEPPANPKLPRQGPRSVYAGKYHREKTPREKLAELKIELARLQAEKKQRDDIETKFNKNRILSRLLRQYLGRKTSFINNITHFFISICLLLIGFKSLDPAFIESSYSFYINRASIILMRTSSNISSRIAINT